MPEPYMKDVLKRLLDNSLETITIIKYPSTGPTESLIDTAFKYLFIGPEELKRMFMKNHIIINRQDYILKSLEALNVRKCK